MHSQKRPSHCLHAFLESSREVDTTRKGSFNTNHRKSLTVLFRYIRSYLIFMYKKDFLSVNLTFFYKRYFVEYSTCFSHICYFIWMHRYLQLMIQLLKVCQTKLNFRKFMLIRRLNNTDVNMTTKHSLKVQWKRLHIL